MRPETIAAGWSNGLPFYCGKTDRLLRLRLYEHRNDAIRKRARVNRRVRELGVHIKIVLMETVPATLDWREREQHWISILRSHFPNTCNDAKGGCGPSGVIRSAEFKARQSARMKNFTLTPEARIKISTSLKGRKRPDLGKQTTAWLIRQWQSEDYRAAMSIVAKTTWQKPNHRERRSAEMRTLWKNSEYREKVSAGVKAARWESSERRERHAAVMRAKWQDPEHRAKVAAAKRARQ